LAIEREPSKPAVVSHPDWKQEHALKNKKSFITSDIKDMTYFKKIQSRRWLFLHIDRKIQSNSKLSF
jgi:hypothetical protein